MPKPRRLTELLGKTREVARQSGSLIVMPSLIKERDRGYELKFNTGSAKHDHPNNFVTFFPAKRLIKPSDDIGGMSEDAGLEIWYEKGWKRYRLNFSNGSFETINPLGVHSADRPYELRD